MAGDIIKMDYGLMEEMSQTFQQGSQQLEDTLREMQAIAKAMEDGVLLGRGGDAFVDAINSKLVASIIRLKEKFNELAGDVQQAMQDMQQADTSSQAMYK